MIPVGAMHLTFESIAAVPPGLRIVAQIAIGMSVGASVRPEALSALRAYWKGALASIVLTVGFGISLGFAFSRASSLSTVGGILSMIPGGASDIAVIAIEYGDEAALIAGIHVLRQLVLVVILSLGFTQALRWTKARDTDGDDLN